MYGNLLVNTNAQRLSAHDYLFTFNLCMFFLDDRNRESESSQQRLSNQKLSPMQMDNRKAVGLLPKATPTPSQSTRAFDLLEKTMKRQTDLLQAMCMDQSVVDDQAPVGRVVMPAHHGVAFEQQLQPPPPPPLPPTWLLAPPPPPPPIRQAQVVRPTRAAAVVELELSSEKNAVVACKRELEQKARPSSKKIRKVGVLSSSSSSQRPEFEWQPKHDSGELILEDTHVAYRPHHFFVFLFLLRCLINPNGKRTY